MSIEEILSAHLGVPVDVERYNNIINEYYKRGKVIVIGPTGSGKTTIPKLILLEDTKNGRFRKLFYLLPTQSLVNAKYMDFLDFSSRLPDKSKVSLLTAFSDEKDWFNPLIVSTYDFYYLIRTFQINYLGRTRQTGAPIGHVVYDELHTFAPSQLAKLTALAKAYGNTIITTATLHPLLRKRIEEELGARTVYLEPFSTHDRVKTIEYIETEEKIDTVIELYRRHKTCKNLIIMNTVSEAIQVFSEITGENNIDAILSQGIIGNAAFLTSATAIGTRQKIEQMIDAGELKTIVATQVAEVGLNYDPDLLITDAAPVDALIQRIGRIRSTGKVFVIKEVETLSNGKYCGIYDNELVNRAFEIIQNENINEILVSNEAAERMLEAVYRDKIGGIIEEFDTILKKAETDVHEVITGLKDVAVSFRDEQRYVYFFDAREDDTATFDRLYRGTFEWEKNKIANKNYIYSYFFDEIKSYRDSVYVTSISNFKHASKEGKSVFNYGYVIDNFYKILRTAPEQSVIIVGKPEDIL